MATRRPPVWYSRISLSFASGVAWARKSSTPEHLFGQKPVREHLVCTECGKVTEIHSSELVRVQEEEAKRHGFLPGRYRLQIYGLCAACQAAGVEMKWEGLTCPIETI
jgi:Fe2+ or Zn2+ uptake regulation protein